MGMSSFLSGVTIGLMITVPIGPMSILCIQRALVFGAATGIATGLGAATVLVTYTACALLGLGPALRPVLGMDEATISAVSAGLLLWFSVRVLSRTVTIPTAAIPRSSPVGSYCTAVALALVNPLTPVLLAAVLPGLAGEDEATVHLLVAGVFAGAVAWWLVVSSCVAALRCRLDIGVLNLVNKASGLALGALGILMVADALGLRL